MRISVFAHSRDWKKRERDRALNSPLFLTFLSFYFSISLPCAHGKTVSIEWRKMNNAVTYEMKLKPASDPENQDILTSESTRWSGDLNPGVYSYQIRGIDPSGQKGRWTGWKFLAVLPESPSPKAPADGKGLVFYNHFQKIPFEWSNSENVKEVKFTLKKDDALVLEKYLSEKSYQSDNLSDGHYKWKIQSVLRHKNSEWETQASKEFELTVEHKKLLAAEFVSPLYPQMPPDDGKITLEWSPVEGADSYEVSVLKIPEKNVASLAPEKSLSELQDELTRVRAYTVSKNSGVFHSSKEGNYLWAVRPLSGPGNVKSAQEKGPYSFGEFSLDRNVVFKSERGYMGLSVMVSPYSYQFVSPSRGVAGNLDAGSIIARVSGDYWLANHWGLSFAVQYAKFFVFDRSFFQPNLELSAKYRAKMDSKSRGWSFYPKIGFEFRDYNLIVPSYPFYKNYAQFTSYNIYTLGASAGVDLRKQWTEHLSTGLKASIFLPLTLLGGDSSGSRIHGGIAKRNVSVGLNTFYWFHPTWGIGAGVFSELKSISYAPKNSNSDERIFMDATYFVGTLMFRFSSSPPHSHAIAPALSNSEATPFTPESAPPIQLPTPQTQDIR